MSEYTAEDFAQVNLATKGRFEVARRTDPNITYQWYAYGDRPGRFSDEELARDGWTPVVEDSETIAGLRHHLALARKELADLRKENDRLEQILQSPLLLEALEAAWEAAEVPSDDNPIRVGDALISSGHGGYLIRSAAAVEDGWAPFDSYRILSRAPKREPWRDLADVLRGTVWERLSGDVDGLAAAVHAAGWRKGGGES